MSFLRFFSRAAHTSSDSGQTSSVNVQDLRLRTKHRLMGTAILVLVGVLGFPLLFESQPRPVSVDIAIDIPNKNTVKPLVLESSALPQAVPAPKLEPELKSEPVAPTAKPASPGAMQAPATPAVAQVPIPAKTSIPAVASLAAREEMVAVTPAAPVPQTVPQKLEPKLASQPLVAQSSSSKVESKIEKVQPKQETKKESKKETKPEVKRPEAGKVLVQSNDGARAAALLEGKPVPKVVKVTEPTVRLVVQVGAFSEVAKAREVRLKLEKAGLKTYSQVLETSDGKRIRVRVGPFASRAEANRIAERVKGLGLSASVLTL